MILLIFNLISSEHVEFLDCYFVASLSNSIRNPAKCFEKVLFILLAVSIVTLNRIFSKQLV